mmetsp:Transcript_88623/g.264350  ORF Transcript_88623/g.264350 Transcript_88623/m.264350 type:complete len:405 (+) Transcript_88623:207-1421(+)
MTLELLLPKKLEAPKRLIANDLVVHRLSNEVLLLRVHHDRRYGVHGRLGNVLHNHRDSVLPHKDLLVVGGGDQTLAFLAEGHGVDRAEVLVVLLHNGCRVRIPLHRLLVRTAADNDVLLGWVWMDRDAEGRLLVRERRDDLAGLRVPELNVLVVGDAVEPPAVAREVHIAHGLVMSHVGAEALPLVVVVPDLDLPVHAGREQQVGGVREPADLLHAHRVARPRVDPLLGQVALTLVNVLGCLGPVLHPRASGVVGLLRAVEDGRDSLLRLALLSLNRLLLLLLAGYLLLPRPHLHFELPPDGGLIREATPLRGRVLLLVGRGLFIFLLRLLLHDLLLGVVAGAPPLCRLVPDGSTLLRHCLGSQEPLLASGHDPGRICRVAKVVEREVLLVEGKRAHVHLLNMA